MLQTDERRSSVAANCNVTLAPLAAERQALCVHPHVAALNEARMSLCKSGITSIRRLDYRTFTNTTLPSTKLKTFLANRCRISAAARTLELQSAKLERDDI